MAKIKNDDSGIPVNIGALFTLGYGQIPRGLMPFDSLFKDWKELVVFLYLVLHANHARGLIHGCRWIERGQCLVTHDEIINVVNNLILGNSAKKMTERELRDRFEWLKESGFIDIQSDRRGTIVTICEYDYYQGGVNRNDRQNVSKMSAKCQQNVRVCTSKMTTNNKNIINNKENNENKEGEFTPPTNKDVYDYHNENIENFKKTYDAEQCYSDVVQNFLDYYETIGWKGVKNWKAAYRKWLGKIHNGEFEI